METRSKVGRLAATVLGAAFLAGMAALPSARAASPPYPADSCYDRNVDCGTAEGDTGVYSAGWDAYGMNLGNCSVRWVRATRRNLAHLVVFRYNEQVRWCWGRGVITYFWRDRWPSDTAFGWSFDGNVGSNCQLEHCNNRGYGTYSTDAWTEGSFHACVIWYCPHKYPIVDIWVHGDGGSGASWAGA
jgi:hypothetical protein